MTTYRQSTFFNASWPRDAVRPSGDTLPARFNLAPRDLETLLAIRAATDRGARPFRGYLEVASLSRPAVLSAMKTLRARGLITFRPRIPGAWRLGHIIELLPIPPDA